MSPRCAGCFDAAGFADGQPRHRARHSVLEVVRAYAAASGRDVPYRIVPRRPGDVAACYADPSLAEQLLGWRAATTSRACARTAGAGNRSTPKDSTHERSGATRDHGRRLRHAAVAAVARRLPQAVPRAVGQQQPVPAGRREAAGLDGDGHRTCIRPLVVGNEEHRFLVLDQLREIPPRTIGRGAGADGAQHRTGADAGGIAGARAAARPGAGGDAGRPDRDGDEAPSPRAMRQCGGRGGRWRHRHPGHRARPARDRLRLHPRRRPRWWPGPVHASSRSPTWPPPSATWPKAATCWNAGMFVLRASVWMAALERFRGDIAAACRAAWAPRSNDQRFVRPGRAEFAPSRPNRSTTR
jgi:hypothetical protein